MHASLVMPPKETHPPAHPGRSKSLRIRYAVVLGHVLSDLRKARGLTQSAFATALGTNQARWSRYERGVGEIPATLLALAAVRMGETPLSLAEKVDRRTRALVKRGVEVQFARLGADDAAGTVGPDELRALYALNLID